VSGAVETSSATPGIDAAAEKATLGQYIRDYIDGLRSGDLGSIPIIIGIIAIAIYFQSRNSNFLTAGNMVNLIVQMAPIAIIGMGIVFVLLLGEIDLSVGYVSAVGGVAVALLLQPDGHNVWSTVPAICAGISVGLVIGLGHGLLITKVGIPSFVVTLAGLLGWNGVVLYLIGESGTVTVQNSFVLGLTSNYVSHIGAWLIIEGTVLVYALIQLWSVQRRRRLELPNPPASVLALKIGGLAIAGAIVCLVVNDAPNQRGLPWVGVLMLGLLIIWTYVSTRTRFGRHVYAVGGNTEAARRAGIGVDRVKIAVFMISSGMACIGGIVLASRLGSVATDAGGGTTLLYSIAAAVIGGTSLFGGRGNVKSAILGAVVIASIDNGLGLLNVKDATRFVVTALVLLAAVTVDSISRKNRAAAGRA
jgi:D-xylose transport system permease protein